MMEKFEEKSLDLVGKMVVRWYHKREWECPECQVECKVIGERVGYNIHDAVVRWLLVDRCSCGESYIPHREYTKIVGCKGEIYVWDDCEVV